MRRLLVVVWLALVASAGFVYVFHRDLLESRLEGSLTGSTLAAGAIYLLLGMARGFTLIPSSVLVFAAVAFIPPVPLFALTLAGILISSAAIYGFADAMGLSEIFERRHPRQIARLRDVLTRYELPIIVGWSFFPLAPTDLVVYVCGALRVNATKCLIGVCLGEGAICGIYIFFGDYLLRRLQ